MASDRMSAALSILIARNFSKMFLRAWQALEFSHGLDPDRTRGAQGQAERAAVFRPTAPLGEDWYLCGLAATVDDSEREPTEGVAPLCACGALP